MPLPAAGTAQRREGRREAACLLAITLLTTALFASGALDIAVAHVFYRAAPTDHWPLAHELPWSLLYRAAPWVTAMLVLAGLVVLAAAFAGRRDVRGAAVLVLLGVAIGPGLLANLVFKDHWQHPRPRDLIEFGGPLHYVPSPLIGSEGGASFPCGHCSVGFMCAAGWWVWRRRRPALAAASLAGGLTLGFLLGVGRMAAGAHFFSDILWSALLAFGVLHLLWYRVLPVLAVDDPAVALGAPITAPPLAEAARRGHLRRLSTLVALLALLAGSAVLLALFVTPHGTALMERVALSDSSPRLLEVEADTANVTLMLLDAPDDELAIAGELHGFGLPGSRLEAHVVVVSQPHPALRYRIESRGWITDVDGTATLSVPAAAFDQIVVSLGAGNITVSDLTRGHEAAAGNIHLVLRTARGHIQQSVRVAGSERR
ncbi:MAG TPA: phosphatase PAP2 family protein [Steroidobacteraceae bacterium]|jgi:membrane-associated PAP2 superfamily phosphatase|nr:phosphatase PAP2 family protein [Steroidobacteraceae bacterium]